MSKLLKSILLSPSGGAAKLEWKKDANIVSAYNLCSSVPVEELTATMASAYVISLLAVELETSMEAAAFNLCTVINGVLTPTLASVYSLSTAAP